MRIPSMPIVVRVVVVGVLGVRRDAGEVKEVQLARGNRGKGEIAEVTMIGGSGWRGDSVGWGRGGRAFRWGGRGCNG